jgi:hypothetical protein
MDPELYLAYDGSINSDWVARYALRLSSNTTSRQLTLLHIMDGSLSVDGVVAKVEQLQQDCRRLAVELKISYLQQQKSVVTTLLDAVPSGKDCYCICGARATSRGKGFLAGTISQELLKARKFNTLALRVVNPGLLGCPANVMFPLCGHPRKFEAAMPFLLMLSPCIKKLVLLRVMTFNPLVFRYLSAVRARKAMLAGVSFLRDVMAEIHSMPGKCPFEMDDHVLISDDWVKEVVVQAGKVRSGLILLGASDRLLQSHFYYGNKIEQLLRRAPCDVGIYRKI